MNPQAGSIGLTRIRGVVGALISAGQWLTGDGWHPTHALVHVGDGLAVWAEPGGARLGRPPAAVTWLEPVPLDGAARTRIAAEARALVGTPYSFADYAALAATALHLPGGRLRRFVADSGHMICSQLVDAAYLRAGVHLFDDGRTPGDVTPGDLARLSR